MEQNVKTYSLSIIIGDEDQEEAHYFHTVNDFVSLIEKYGWSQVIGDLREAMGNKTWQ